MMAALFAMLMPSLLSNAPVESPWKSVLKSSKARGDANAPAPERNAGRADLHVRAGDCVQRPGRDHHHPAGHYLDTDHVTTSGARHPQRRRRGALTVRKLRHREGRPRGLDRRGAVGYLLSHLQLGETSTAQQGTMAKRLPISAGRRSVLAKHAQSFCCPYRLTITLPFVDWPFRFPEVGEGRCCM